MEEKRELTIPLGSVQLAGLLTVPENATRIILFAHGSGSSRYSPRNNQVAESFNELGFATLLMDLLTPEEEQVDLATREHRFDIPTLAERVAKTVDWLVSYPETKGMAVGLIGSSTGAAAALAAAAFRPHIVKAVVSRGGRPDLAGSALANVCAPTLLIVGEEDKVVIELNQLALSELLCEKEMVLIPRATHLFEEPGTLEAAAKLAASWFQRHL